MAEALPSTSGSRVSLQQKNITMLIDKLKELQMGSENATDGRVFGRIESKYYFCKWFFSCDKFIKKNVWNLIRFTEERTG